MKVPAWPVAGVVFASLWLFVRGIELAPSVIVGQFLFGLAVGLPVAFLFRRLYTDRVDLERVVRGSPYAVAYLVTFGYELLRANLDVTYRVLAPEPAIEPDVILIPLRVESDVAITVIANSITITPGTVTLDYDDARNALFVHAIDGRDPEAVGAPIRNWENYALEIFDEDRSPTDPAPAIVVGTEHESGIELESATEHESRIEQESATESEDESGTNVSNEDGGDSVTSENVDDIGDDRYHQDGESDE